MKKRFGILATVLGTLVWASLAEATPITGSIEFTGCVNPEPGQLWSSTTTSMQFLPCGPGTSNPPTVTSGTGSYTGTAGSTVSFTSFTFDPFPAGGVIPLWTFTSGATTYSFNLTSVGSFGFIDPTFTLTGGGTLLATGLDPTTGTFTFSSSNPASPGPDQFKFSFRAGNTAVPPVIPEPASMVLLGTGLAGVAAAVRRRQTRRRHED